MPTVDNGRFESLMNMKKIYLLVLLISASLNCAFAQDENPTKREKMFREVQEFKMKYLAQEMDLSDSQKKQFFELYEAMSKKKQECYQEAVKMDRALKHDKEATEAEYQNVTEAFNKANLESAEIDKEYNEKFAEFLTPKQIYRMKEAESEFKAKLDEMRHNRKKGKDHQKKHDEKR